MMLFSFLRTNRPASAVAALLLSSLAGLSSLSAAETADQLMAQAHAGRAEWNNFSGFTADITAATDGRVASGKLQVSADGEVKLELSSDEGMEWVKRSLESVVRHRLADNEAISGLEFADDDQHHPLGRLLKSRDEGDKNLWRVKGDVLTEVQRVMPKSRFIISIADVSRNAEGKHLPRNFTVTTWNNDGAIQTTRQVFNEWKQVGGVDLPVRLLAANSKADGTRTVEEIVFSNHQLPTTATSKVKVVELAPLPKPVTSFGAAVTDGSLYVYGGHLGATHKYSSDQHSRQLLRLDLSKPSQWEVVAEGPGRTGLTMVAYNGKLYRVGGWEAKNAAGKDADLYSTRDFARFDPKSGKWEDLAQLPEGRSSHDTAVLGSHLYLIGGWDMQGGGEGEYHNTAYVCDLAASEPKWEKIATPPINRRALGVAAWQGKIYAIGGMDDANDATTAVYSYDPQSKVWHEGPALPGKPMEGFGTSAFGTANGLFATAGSGLLFQLTADGKGWKEVGKLNHPRMAHRLLAKEDGTLIAVGGASRKGKVAEVEAIQVKVAVK